MKRLLMVCGVVFTLIQLQGCIGLLAAGATGTAIMVTDPRTTEQQLADQRIELKASEIIGEAPFNTDAAHFNVVSFYSKELLVGQTLDTELVSQLVAKLKQIKGVKKIYNQVRYVAPVGVAQISEDALITTRVKTALLGDQDVPSNAIKVVTENSEVFLMGTVTSEQAQSATETARNISGVAQVIVAFDISQEEE